MTDLDQLIEWWKLYLEFGVSINSPLFSRKVEITIKYLKELRVRKGE